MASWDGLEEMVKKFKFEVEKVTSAALAHIEAQQEAKAAEVTKHHFDSYGGRQTALTLPRASQRF